VSGPPRGRPPCVITLSTGERHERPTLARAEVLLHDLLYALPAGTTAEVRQGTRRLTYSRGTRGGIRRGPPPKHAGGRPTASPDGRRELVAVRLSPAALAALARLQDARSETRTEVVERLVLEAADTP
jgi:hypothetical protein